MWPAKQRLSRASFNAETLPTLWTDFNTVPDDGMLRSSHVAGFVFAEQLAKGSWVRLTDHEGYSCIGRIRKIRGQLFYLEPNWSTWTAAPEVTLVAPPAPTYAGEPQLVAAGEPVGHKLVTAGEPAP